MEGNLPHAHFAEARVVDVVAKILHLLDEGANHVSGHVDLGLAELGAAEVIPLVAQFGGIMNL